MLVKTDSTNKIALKKILTLEMIPNSCKVTMVILTTIVLFFYIIVTSLTSSVDWVITRNFDDVVEFPRDNSNFDSRSALTNLRYCISHDSIFNNWDGVEENPDFSPNMQPISLHEKFK